MRKPLFMFDVDTICDFAYNTMWSEKVGGRINFMRDTCKRTYSQPPIDIRVGRYMYKVYPYN